ncbi:hypothetical protein A3Q56_04684 [Intoshia linei]|uniref:Uncharacterized protein n=1 Tax=Intoshia linei TaxID=1819745 RepID=A0A177B2E7_9BILA|nr:hypothetical protein A3Q56_04684 [Intoshia linei]
MYLLNQKTKPFIGKKRPVKIPTQYNDYELNIINNINSKSPPTLTDYDQERLKSLDKYIYLQ